VITGAAFNYIATISNLGPNPGAVQIAIPVTGAAITAVTASAGTCTTAASTATCDIPALNNGSTATVRVDVSAAAVGTTQAVATATFSGTDPVATNNSVTVTTTVNSPPTGGASGGGGGGGGRFDWLALALLGALAWRRWRTAAAR
jgi:hypothetical protein